MTLHINLYGNPWLNLFQVRHWASYIHVSCDISIPSSDVD
jgi:hypothetical protein